VNGLAGAGGGIVSQVLTYPLLAVSAYFINSFYEDIWDQLAQVEGLYCTLILKINSRFFWT
jgi:hypothetical protein